MYRPGAPPSIASSSLSVTPQAAPSLGYIVTTFPLAWRGAYFAFRMNTAVLPGRNLKESSRALQ